MPDPITLVARLYEHIEPLDRGARYEAPLDAALRAAKSGEVTGGGSQLGQTGEIEFADVEIQVSSVGDALPVIVRSIESVLRPMAIGQNARVVVRSGRADSEHRTLRMPRQ